MELRRFQKDFLRHVLRPEIDVGVLSLPRGNGKSTFAGHIASRIMNPDMALVFPHIASITRNVPGPLNPLGQPTPGVDRVVHDQLPCRLRERSESEIAGDGKYFSLADYSLRIPLDADVRRNDKVTVGGIRGVVRFILDRFGYQRAMLESVRRDGPPRLSTMGGFARGFSSGFNVVRDT